jgi:hypothetical protein
MNRQLAAPTIPATPYTAHQTSVLSEDLITTSDILVNAASRNPVAAFANPNRGGATEALIVSGGDLCYVARDPDGDSGWVLNRLRDGLPAVEVAVGVQLGGAVHAFWQDGEATHHSQLSPEGVWSAPERLPLAADLAVAYAPNRTLVLYGRTPSGDLLTVHQPSLVDPAWRSTVVALSGALSNARPSLVLTGPTSWTLAAAVQAEMALYTGQLGESTPASGPKRVTTPEPVRELVYGHYRQGSVLFMFIDHKGALAGSVGTTADVRRFFDIPNSQLVTAAVVPDPAGLLNAYGLDDLGRLWILHQKAWDSTGGPVFAPLIPMDAGLTSISVNTAPGAAAEVFGVDGGVGALRLLNQDPQTRTWSTGPVQESGGQGRVYRVPRYRCEVRLLDDNGNPVAGREVAVGAESAVQLWTGGRIVPATATRPATLTTNVFGRLSMSVLATTVHTPQLTLAADGLVEPLRIAPNQAVQDYLAGTGDLPGLPRFDAATLREAKVGDEWLAPALHEKDPPLSAEDAVDGVRHTIAVGQAIQRGEDPMVALTRLGNRPIAGFALDLRDRKRAGFRTFRTTEEVHEHLRNTAGPDGVEGFWDDVAAFIDDVWHGIERGAIALRGFVVDLANRTVSLAVQIGRDLVELSAVVIRGVKDAISVVHGILNVIGAAAAKVIEFLKALFSWNDIWDTKTALEEALTKTGPYLKEQIAEHGTAIVDEFFAGLRKKVTQGFDDVRGLYQLGTTFDDLAGSAPAIGAGNRQARRARRPGRPVTALGAFDPASLDTAHNNWFLDKVLSYLGPGSPLPLISDLSRPIADLQAAVHGARNELDKAIGDFQRDFLALLARPDEFGKLLVKTFLDLAEHVALAALAFADGVVKALLDTASLVAGTLDALWHTPVPVPPIVTLVEFIARAAHPSANPPVLTVGGLFCTIAAVPMTLAYKAAHGVHAQLFPGGRLPTAQHGAALHDERSSWVFAGIVLQAMWTMFDAGMDLNEEPDIYVLNVTDVVVQVLLQVFTWPTGDGVPFRPVPLQTDAEKAVFANWMVSWTFPIVDAALLMVPAGSMFGRTIARYSEPGKLFQSGVGALNLATGCIEISVAGEKGGAAAANILGPIPDFLQLLRLAWITDATGGISQIVKIVIDFFCGAGTAAAMADV